MLCFHGDFVLFLTKVDQEEKKKKEVNMQTHASIEKKLEDIECGVKSAKLLCRSFCWLRNLSKNRSFKIHFISDYKMDLRGSSSYF